MRRLGDRLRADDVISQEALDKALEIQRSSGSPLGEVLVLMGAIKLTDLKPYLEATTGFPFVDIAEIEVDRALATQVPETVLVPRRALPFRTVEGEIHVAMADPLDLAVVDDLKARLRRTLVPHLAFPKELEEATRRAFDARSKAQSVLNEIGGDVVEVEEEEAHADDAPIVRLVNGVLSAASASRASDVHFEPQEANVRVRFRIDGVMVSR